MPLRYSLTPAAKNEFLEAICNSQQEGAAVIERSTERVVFYNHAWPEIFGFDSCDEITMQDLNRMRKVKLPDEEFRRRLAAVEQKGVYNEEVEFLSRGNLPFWAEMSIRMFTAGSFTYYLVVIDKIDRLKESEQTIARDKQRFTALLEHASMGILETNKSAEIIDINRSALKLFGYEKQEVLNKKIELLIPMRFHSKHEEHRNHYLDHPRNRPMGLGMDLFAVKKDGREFPVEVSLTNYTLGGESYVVAFISDITIRKKNELEIKKLNDELEEMVEIRTKELKHAIQLLETSREELYRSLEKEKELNELKSRFVTMASHEFRTPLSTVLSSAYLLEQYNAGDDYAKQQKHINRIVSSVNMLTDTLNDFLSVGKIEEGKIHVKFTAFDIQKLMQSAVDEIRVNLKKEQTIEYRHNGNSLATLDPSLLKHIILNLLSNASKFSTDDGAIIITTSVLDDFLTLSVKDHGIGISAEDQQHLMERFFRGRNALNIQGTGLGLHIVSKYAELMNGSVKCISELGKGTTFILTFSINKETHEKDTGN